LLLIILLERYIDLSRTIQGDLGIHGIRGYGDNLRLGGPVTGIVPYSVLKVVHTRGLQ